MPRHTIPSNNFIGNLTFGANDTLYTVGFDFSNNNYGAILRYDGVTGNPLPSVGNNGAILVPTNSKLLRPIGITYASEKLASVPEPATVGGLLTLGGLLSVSRIKRDRKPAN